MTPDLESARRDWADGFRRLDAEAAGTAAAARLHRQLDVVTEELRRRVGSTFTLAELAAEYARCDPWVQQAIGERAAAPGYVRTVSLVADAAFHLYARGAVDYVP